VYNKLRPQRQSYKDLVPTVTIPLPSFAPGVAPAFSRYSLYTKAIKQLFHPSAGAAFGGMDVYFEKTLSKVTFSAWVPRWVLLAWVSIIQKA